MSMLAEPRRKQKLSIDPRGSNWSKDESKFGQKMLEKFGWSKGKGLGANEDGLTDHVKVSLKNDNHGLGCSKSQVDNWIAHQDDFNALLANLNQSNTQIDTEKVSSLENRSKTSKSRVHYQKFTKGKDLSAKSSQDLDCIFGRRTTKTEDTVVSETPNNDGDIDPMEKVKGGFITVNSEQSIQDYFAKKMTSLKNSRSSSQPELHSILKGHDKENASFIDDKCSDDSVSNSSSKRVSFMIGNEEDSNDSKSSSDDESIDLKSSDEELDSKSIKKKNKKRKHEEADENQTIEENELDTCQNDVKKAKKSKLSKNESDMNTEEQVKASTSNKKRKKRKICLEGDKTKHLEELVKGQNETERNIGDKLTGSDESSEASERKKKRKNKDSKDQEYVDKRIQKTKLMNALGNFTKEHCPEFVLNDKLHKQKDTPKEISNSTSEVENKKKKKRKNKKKSTEKNKNKTAEDNCSSNKQSDLANKEGNTGQSKRKRKKNKKKEHSKSSEEKLDDRSKESSTETGQGTAVTPKVMKELQTAFKGSSMTNIVGYASLTGYNDSTKVDKKIKKKMKQLKKNQ
ncbi:PIN2/TERF1-interacting telomerase inhibitor 1-like [Mytilus edulis]|uniref:PIN2/TERF1-interacting telomerase inhibitor 1-like n=1 Tax=Mytilus edulis TaxID=6550 RepID=UPI0039F14C4E